MMPTGQYAAAEPASGGKSKTPLIIGGSAVAGAIVLVLVLKASGLLGAKQTAAPAAGVLAAPQTQTAPAPILQAPRVDAPKPTAPVLTPPKGNENPMPDDVVAWLRWLKKVEAYRRQLKGDSDAQLIMAYMEMIKAPLQEMMKEPDEIKDSNMVPKQAFAQMNALNQKWNQLAGVFQAGPQPPDWPAGRPNLPEPCAPVAGAYNRMLGTVVSQQAQLLQLAQAGFQSVKPDGGATPDVQNILSRLYGESANKGMSHAADATFVDSDSSLNALRDRYTSMPPDIDRYHFDIKDESKVSVPNAPSMPTF